MGILGERMHPSLRVYGVSFLLFSLACAGGGDSGNSSADISVQNNYAESIFTVRYQVDGETEWTALEGERVGDYGLESFNDIIDAPDGADLFITVETISLGQTYTFQFNETMQAGGDLLICYSYDLALAQFAVSYAWNGVLCD